jgi:non-ribosomal peptide synthase protein (TIGR01720 family)
LTPIQHWFFEQDLPEPHHYNQARLLEGPPNLDAAFLEEALTCLLRHHDALRLRFARTQTGWKQRNAEVDEETASFFSRMDLSSLPAVAQQQVIEAAAAKSQASLNLEHGPLLRAVLFSLGPETPCRLLLIIHHLAVDGVSWRILLEDLETAYQQLLRGEAPQLPAKTTSFQRWAEQLSDYAQSETLLRETDYWLAGKRQRVASLPVDHLVGPEANTEESARIITITLSAAETQALLQDVLKAYHTQINDVLLTALVETFRAWTGAPALLVDLEGHGRESILEEIDLSHTVGWFTSIFPVLLDIEGVSGPGETLPAIKEQLRQVPQRGIGYGLLRYLRKDREIAGRLQQMPQAEISFNYLGQFDQGVSEATLFRPARESSGPVLSPRGKRRHLLELIGSVADGQLRLIWIYSDLIHTRATIELLAHRYKEVLRELIAHCLSPEAGGHTPSDFPLAKLDARTLRKLSSLIEEEA